MARRPAERDEPARLPRAADRIHGRRFRGGPVGRFAGCRRRREAGADAGAEAPGASRIGLARTPPQGLHPRRRRLRNGPGVPGPPGVPEDIPRGPGAALDHALQRRLEQRVPHPLAAKRRPQADLPVARRPPAGTPRVHGPGRAAAEAAGPALRDLAARPRWRVGPTPAAAVPAAGTLRRTRGPVLAGAMGRERAAQPG